MPNEILDYVIKCFESNLGVKGLNRTTSAVA